MFIDEEASCAEDHAFDVYSLIPTGSGMFNYIGGLTTPSCSQVVRWNLMDRKVSITMKQWSALANVMLGYGGHVDDDDICQMEHTVASETGSTSRKVQPINGRTVSHRCNAVA
jgi:carbonic anhydrase